MNNFWVIILSIVIIIVNNGIVSIIKYIQYLVK